jgi:RNA polymerase sigma-70 factor (ECF subfamily)
MTNGATNNTNVPDSKAFEILIIEHHKRLLAYALSITRDGCMAEDIVQDALVVAFRKLDTFDTSRSFSAWVRGIIRNKHLEHLRKKRELLLDENELDSLEACHSAWDSSGKDDCEIFHILSECVKKLPEILLLPIRMFYFVSMNGAEVADSLKCNEATVRKRLQRGRERLSSCIETVLSGKEYSAGEYNED